MNKNKDKNVQKSFPHIRTFIYVMIYDMHRLSYAIKELILEMLIVLEL